MKYNARQMADLNSSREAMRRDGGLAPRLKARIEIMRENFRCAENTLTNLPGMLGYQAEPDEDDGGAR